MSDGSSASHTCLELNGAEVHCRCGDCPYCNPDQSDLDYEEVRTDVSSPDQTRAALEKRIGSERGETDA